MLSKSNFVPFNTQVIHAQWKHIDCVMAQVAGLTYSRLPSACMMMLWFLFISLVKQSNSKSLAWLGFTANILETAAIIGTLLLHSSWYSLSSCLFIQTRFDMLLSILTTLVVSYLSLSLSLFPREDLTLSIDLRISSRWWLCCIIVVLLRCV